MYSYEKYCSDIDNDSMCVNVESVITFCLLLMSNDNDDKEKTDKVRQR